MNAVRTGRRRYWEAGSDEIIVSGNSREKVQLPLSTFHYVAPLSVCLNVCCFVLGMRLTGRKLLLLIAGRKIHTACSGSLFHWINFGNKVAA